MLGGLAGRQARGKGPGGAAEAELRLMKSGTCLGSLALPLAAPPPLARVGLAAVATRRAVGLLG